MSWDDEAATWDDSPAVRAHAQAASVVGLDQSEPMAAVLRAKALPIPRPASGTSWCGPASSGPSAST